MFHKSTHSLKRIKTLLWVSFNTVDGLSSTKPFTAQNVNFALII